MNKSEMDKLRSSVILSNEVLKVRYIGDASNFASNTVLEAIPRFVTKSGLPYPQPKWKPSEYYVVDLDGEPFKVAEKRYGELYKGFEWVLDKEDL